MAASLLDTVINGDLHCVGSISTGTLLPMDKGGTGSTTYPVDSLLMMNNGGTSIGYASLIDDSYYNLTFGYAGATNRCNTYAYMAEDAGTSGRYIYVNLSAAVTSMPSTVGGYKLSSITSSSLTFKDVNPTNFYVGNSKKINGRAISFSVNAVTSSSLCVFV